VVVSTLLLLAAATLLAAMWLATSTTSSTSFTAQIPSTLGHVVIEVSSGNVEILGSTSPDVLVSRVDSSVFGHSPEERRFVADDVFRIESSCAQLVVGSCAADYRLTVPEKVRLTIVAEHGDVRLTAYRGSAVVSTRGGTLTVNAFCGATLDASSKSGDIEVVATCPPQNLTLRTTTGDITVRVPPDRYSVDADTIGGKLALLGLEDDAGARSKIQALSNSGDVRLEAGS
jgi:DUF4097 and DUF4098 domain-containing protein YvlB